MLIARIGARHTVWLCVHCAEVAANRQRFIDKYAESWGLPAAGAEGGRTMPPIASEGALA